MRYNKQMKYKISMFLPRRLGKAVALALVHFLSARLAVAGQALAFQSTEGSVQNLFYRQGAVAAHVVASSGQSPRLVFAFPAGNSGAGLWFQTSGSAAELQVDGPLEAIERADGMRGVAAVVSASAGSLVVRKAMLGSIRALRDFNHDGRSPAGMENNVIAGLSVTIKRTALDRVHHHELALSPIAGTRISVRGDETIVMAAPEGGRLSFRATALNDYAPLSPIAAAELLRPDAVDDGRARNALEFLSYKDKLLAGSWQYLTYFGRDTLLSVRMLMPSLQPGAIEAGLGSVIARLSQNGVVAHEEDIGEWAVIRHLASPAPPADLNEPIYDYGMIDGDFLLAPVLARYLLDSPEGTARASTFLAGVAPDGRSYADALLQNLKLVVARARPFGKDPSPKNLVSLLPGRGVGQWRDSNEGLGGGRYPFDVNAALVPAALEAAARLLEGPLRGRDDALAAEARRLSPIWKKAADYFIVDVPLPAARERVRAYARSQGIDPASALRALERPASFHAVALDDAGRPIPILNSDEGFVLLFTDPSYEDIVRALQGIRQPFPAGLRTPVGMVVANPAYATDPKLRDAFTRGHYHGTVVWSWQQALLAAGIERQLARPGLPDKTRALLREARSALWDTIRAGAPMRHCELWSWTIKDGQYQVVPFGQEAGHVTESNAAQLWSTVYLAVRPGQ